MPDAVLAIDPGTEKSAFVCWDGERVVGKGIVDNPEILDFLRSPVIDSPGPSLEDLTLVVEMVASYGMPVGAEVFETCVWIGKFLEAWDWRAERMFRLKVKLHLCHDSRAKDSNIRQALIDRFGGKEKAIGGKKCQRCKGKGWAGRDRATCESCAGHCWEIPPGPLYKVAKDMWSALAIAVTWYDQKAVRVGLFS